jgi:myo-inositol 2-dehydrogenase/D-chiro-inositol 1-dehydrogenase
MKIGIFGIGRIGRVHAAIAQSQGQEIVCIGDDSLACCKDALSVLGLDEKKVSVFGSAEEMAKSGLADAVVVASHTKDHARHGLPFIEAGVPIYMEKPLTADLTEAFEFTARVGSSRTLLQIGLQRRFDNALCYAKQLLTSGAIGDVREIRCVLRDQFPPPSTYVSPGLIIDMGIHVADEAIWLLDEFPNKVWAQLFDAKQYHYYY